LRPTASPDGRCIKSQGKPNKESQKSIDVDNYISPLSQIRVFSQQPKDSSEGYFPQVEYPLPYIASETKISSKWKSNLSLSSLVSVSSSSQICTNHNEGESESDDDSELEQDQEADSDDEWELEAKRLKQVREGRITGSIHRTLKSTQETELTSPRFPLKMGIATQSNQKRPKCSQSELEVMTGREEKKGKEGQKWQQKSTKRTSKPATKPTTKPTKPTKPIKSTKPTKPKLSTWFARLQNFYSRMTFRK